MTRLRSWLVVAMVQWSCYRGLLVFVVFLDFVHKRNAFCGGGVFGGAERKQMATSMPPFCSPL